MVLLGVHLARRLALSARYRLDFVSVVADLAIAIVFLVKAAILNSTRLDCQVLLREKCKLPLSPSLRLSEKPVLLNSLRALFSFRGCAHRRTRRPRVAERQGVQARPEPDHR